MGRESSPYIAPAITTDTLPHTTPKHEEGQDVNEAISAITAKDKVKAEHEAKWLQRRKVYDDAIVELKGEIPELQAAMRELKEKEDCAKRGWIGGPYGVTAWTLVWVLSVKLGWIKGFFLVLGPWLDVGLLVVCVFGLVSEFIFCF
jgi:hypothetical protein